MLLFIGDADAAQSGDEDSFDTSHVTLYLVQPDFYLLVDVFQYISCYSLSRWIVIYALFLHVSIHLMLLFIRNAEGNWRIRKACFNTSHVTLYQILEVYRLWIALVSIHLMLLFILMEDGISPDYSCFNTSHVTLYRLLLTAMLKRQCSFNTSHVTLYPGQARRQKKTLSFQYISCYSLSEKNRYRIVVFIRFNTSHVTLYRFCSI